MVICYYVLTKRESMYASHELKTMHLLVYRYIVFRFLMMVPGLLRLSAEEHSLWKPPWPLVLGYFSNVALTKSFLIYLPVPGISKQPFSLHCFSCMREKQCMCIRGDAYWDENIQRILIKLWRPPAGGYLLEWRDKLFLKPLITSC